MENAQRNPKSKKGRRDDRRVHHNNNRHHRAPPVRTLGDFVVNTKLSSSNEEQPREEAPPPRPANRQHNDRPVRRNFRHPHAPPRLSHEQQTALGPLPSWDEAGEDDDFDYMAYRDALIAQQSQQSTPISPDTVFWPVYQQPHQQAFYYDQQYIPYQPSVPMYAPAMYVPGPMYSPGPLYSPGIPQMFFDQSQDDTQERVRHQIEYYFLKENLEKDFFLRTNMNKEGYLPLNFVASFPRVRSMTTDLDLIVAALRGSDVVEISDCGGSKVRPRDDPTQWPISSSATSSDDSRSHSVSSAAEMAEHKQKDDFALNLAAAAQRKLEAEAPATQ